MSGSDPNNVRHPESTFKTEYPYNQATVTRGGHEFHVNDTPDNESLRVAHTTGTYVEIEKTGRWVHTVVEKVYNYFKGTFTQSIDSHADIKIGGTYAMNIDKSSYEAVGLDKTVGVGGDLVDGVGGVRQLHTERDKFESINGSHTFSVKGDTNEFVEGSKNSVIIGPKAEILSDSWFVSGKDMEMNSDGDFRISCTTFKVDALDSIEMNALGGEVVINGATSITIKTSAGPITVTGEGVVYINGTQIRLND